MKFFPRPVVHALLFTLGLSLSAAVSCAADKAEPQQNGEPAVIDPGPVGGAPSDAIVLFNGKDLSQWKNVSGATAKWKVEDGFVEVNGTGNIVTRQEFGDIQLHVEWATPREVKGEGQGRGNSGVYLQGRYEIQVLDSYQNKTYANGQAGALYGIAAPLVNASRKPGEWQVYEKVFILYTIPRLWCLENHNILRFRLNLTTI